MPLYVSLPWFPFLLSRLYMFCAYVGLIALLQFLSISHIKRSPHTFGYVMAIFLAWGHFKEEGIYWPNFLTHFDFFCHLGHIEGNYVHVWINLLSFLMHVCLRSITPWLLRSASSCLVCKGIVCGFSLWPCLWLVEIVYVVECFLL